MKYLQQLPETAEGIAKKRKSLAAQRKALTACCFLSGIFAILLLLGTLIALFTAELGKFGQDVKTLLYILTGAFLGGALVFALFAVLLSRIAQNAVERELDFLERCDGETSFFVGEGTLATFGGGKVRLHNEKNEQTIDVPYEDIRLFSVCTRHAPKEKGEWSVVIELPARYLSKKPEKNAPPALIQTDAKPRLYDCLRQEGLELIGALPVEGQKRTYNRVKKYDRPDRKKRSRALIFIVVGAAVCVGAVCAGIFWEAMLGAVAGVVGAFLLGRATYAYIKAKSSMILCREGLWWKEAARADSVFLEWQEIERCEREEHNKTAVLTLHCAYGAYHFPAFEGAEEEIENLRQQSRDGKE